MATRQLQELTGDFETHPWPSSDDKCGRPAETGQEEGEQDIHTQQHRHRAAAQQGAATWHTRKKKWQVTWVRSGKWPVFSLCDSKT